MQIAIFGGGIAGLMTAITLHLRGHHCALYERSRLAQYAGMGFILMPKAITYMEGLGIQITEGYKSVLLDRYIYRDPGGKVLYEEEMPRMARSIRRCELIRALVDAAGLKNAITFDAELEQLEFDQHGHVAAGMLSCGERITADLFIAADGSRSRIRRTLFPDWPLQKARVLEVVGLVRCAEAARWAGRNLNKFHAAGGGLAVGILPVDSECVVWFMQFDSLRFEPPRGHDANSNNKEWRDFVLRMAGAWAFPVASMLANTDSRSMHLWSPLDVDLLPSFHRENVVLAGDAAHPLSPFTSQGVASAIADAVLLADVLPQTSEKCLLEKALAFYSRQRLRQCARYLNAGRRLMRRFLAPVSGHKFVLPLAR